MASKAAEPPAPAEAPISGDQVRKMMLDAQRTIEERKRQLALSGAGRPGAIPGLAPNMQVQFPPSMASVGASSGSTAFQDEKMRKLAELREQISSRIASSTALKGKIAEEPELPSKPVPLLLDNEGRVIDNTGNRLLFPTHQPTLKANIRAQKRHDVKVQEKEKEIEPEPEDNKYFDERLAAKTTLKARTVRAKSGLKFNEPGKYVTLAHRQRMQAQLSRLQSEIADKAHKTGISTAARLARLSGAVASSAEKQEYIPQMEWWDALLMEDKETDQLGYEYSIDKSKITNLIEHPIQPKCPSDLAEPVYLPVYLTKKEQKKLRRQNRREAWKEKQEKIRLGLDPAPAAKVRISNLMRVLGVEAVQDPTKVEAHVRKQMALRLKTHKDANLNRKLTPEQKREKKLSKLKEDTSSGVHVTVYRIDDLTNQSKKFKVEANAKQLTMTGCLLLFRECNVVIVEGGPKQQKKYKRLMMNRIKWDEDLVKGKDVNNKIVLVWEGTAKSRCFRDMNVKLVQTEEQARDYFRKHNVQHLWDLALSGTVLENIIDVV